jgi:ABC-type microcin C transport system permease subunit YejE
VLSLGAEFIANDKPILAMYKGELLVPALVDYPEEKFGGFYAVTDYRDPVISDEIEANGWLIWPPIRYSYRTVNNDIPEAAPAKPSWMYDKARRAASAIRWRTTRTARSATGTGSAPTTRRATCWRASSTASASRCCSA